MLSTKTRREVLDKLTRKLGRTSAHVYLEARDRGLSVSHAHGIMADDRDARAVLTWSADEGGAPYGNLMDAYDVDAAELSRVTSRPVPHVTSPDGTHPVYRVDLPAGATARVYVYADDDSNHQDFDSYSPDDAEAWQRDAWRYVGVCAVVTLADGRTGEAAVWGVEQGDYWPGTDLSQLWHVVPDQISEALHDVPELPKPIPGRFLATVVIECATQEEAEQVIGERIGHDEDYGFPYSIDVQRVKPATS